MIKLITSLLCVLIIIYNYHKKQFVSSSTMWVFAYFLILVFCPIYSKESTYKNEGLIDVLAFVGINVFFVGMLLGDKYKFYIKRNKDKSIQLIPDFRVAKISFVIVFILSIATLVYLLGTGGIQQILAGTKTAKQFVLSKDNSSNTYSLTVHMMVPCILAMWITAKDKNEQKFRWVALSIYVLETVLFGFTRLFLISILSIVFIYEIRKKEQIKQLFGILIGLIGIIFAMVFLNFVRSRGWGYVRDFSKYISPEYILTSTDFQASYYWFNELLNFESPYINPIVYLKPLFVFIPRSIWPTKPDPLSLQVLKYVNPAIARTGYSTAGNSVLGEGYAIFGYFGMFAFIFVWGFVCSRLDKEYFKRLRQGYDTSLKEIVYYIFAVFIVISGQRGDWSQYMVIVCWLYYLPLYIMSRVTVRLKQAGNL